MAGEQSNPQADYDIISSTKLMNKAGVLELSAKIKAYIDANSGGGSTPIKYISVVFGGSPQISSTDQTYLQNLYNSGYESYPCIIKYTRPSFGLTDPMYFYYGYKANNKIVFIGADVQTSIPTENASIKALVFSNTGYNNSWGMIQEPQSYVGYVRVPQFYTVSGNNNSNMNSEFYYIKQNYATKAELPAAYTLPEASTSTLGGVKVDGTTITIDANGVISSSGGGGGGTTYTAGTGIDITNGVISVSLNRAEGGSY